MDKCIICDSNYALPLYTGIVKCQECGHVFSQPYPDEEQLFDLYSKKYFFGFEYHDYLADREAFQKNFKLRLKVLRDFLDPIRRKHLLEIGCAYGFFLCLARDLFDTVQGIDIAEDGILYAKEQLKLNVINADFLKYDFGDQKFDVVCMWDTIEHLCRPHLYLDKMRRLMERGSLLAITTGDVGSLNARIRKDKWRLMHSPTHVHFFSKKTLAKLLDNNGFDIIYNRYCGFHRSIDMVAYSILVLRKRGPWLYNFLRKSRLTNIDFYSNLYDIMYVIARKR